MKPEAFLEDRACRLCKKYARMYLQGSKGGPVHTYFLQTLIISPLISTFPTLLRRTICEVLKIRGVSFGWMIFIYKQKNEIFMKNFV